MTLAHAGHKAAPQTVASDRRASTGPDVVVIGAGVIGVSCALELARVGLRVKVLDRQVPSMCASYGNAGYIATEQVFPIVDASVIKRIPGMLLDQQGPLRLDWRYIPKAAPWLLRLLWNLRPKPYERSVAGIRALNESSLAAWRQLLTSTGRRELLSEEGSLLAHERDETRDDLEAAAQRLSSQDHVLERLSGEVMTSMSEGLRLAGTVEFAGLDRSPGMERAWRLCDHARGMFSRQLKGGGDSLDGLSSFSTGLLTSY